ncbi:hypothetical protein [Spiroplasma alleghenense]|uniref:Transmembrane protein n=1 Tax=Spiroplasma alleghenense TaxID=216931 RepID=A0A345Z4A7_9MOLU|nr:hypothetical protein [Spiroplasma alleghenense]AXK51436.1 transmembrane protein [Spiroplasma alleghenense]
MAGLSNMNFLLLITVASTFLFLVGVRLYFTLYHNKMEVPVIKSADINISSSKIDEMIRLFQIYSNCADLKVVYERQNSYIKTFCNLNRKKKLIIIPTITINSVGYEIDYILGRIWTAAKIYNKNPNIMNYRRLTIIYPIFFKIVYYAFLVFSIILFILSKVDYENIILSNSFLFFLYRIPILSITTIAAFLGLIILFVMAQNSKINLEDYYEMEVSVFVKDQLVGYQSDYLAARVYSRSIPYLQIPIMKFSRSTDNIKYFGPFNLF